MIRISKCLRRIAKGEDRKGKSSHELKPKIDSHYDAKHMPVYDCLFDSYDKLLLFYIKTVLKPVMSKLFRFADLMENLSIIFYMSKFLT